VTITIVRALDLATRVLLQSEHPDAIDARVALLELCELLERYEHPHAVPMMKLNPQRTKPLIECWCGLTSFPGVAWTGTRV
jgi:hypothetical protein